MDTFVIVSGCSGDGKSTLLNELSRQGYATVEEPGRRIVREQLGGKGTALPWIDQVAFIRRVITQARSNFSVARELGGRWVFFDRSLLDAAIALQHLTGEATSTSIGSLLRYHQRVFMAPQWPEMYVTDSERRHSPDVGVAEYQRLMNAYPALGYEVLILPKVAVAERAEFVLRTLSG